MKRKTKPENFLQDARLAMTDKRRAEFVEKVSAQVLPALVYTNAGTPEHMTERCELAIAWAEELWHCLSRRE